MMSLVATSSDGLPQTHSRQGGRYGACRSCSSGRHRSRRAATAWIQRRYKCRASRPASRPLARCLLKETGGRLNPAALSSEVRAVDVARVEKQIAGWLAVIATPLPVMASRQPTLYASLRPALARIYQDAGSPLGEEESAMLAWWQERAQTGRDGWLPKSARGRAPSSRRPSRVRAR